MSAPKCCDVPHGHVCEVCLKMPTTKLLQLLYSGSLHVEDFRCLDAMSRDRVKSLLLTCLNYPEAHEI